MLQDTNTYIKIKKDPTRGMINDLRGLLTRWRNSEYISASKYKSLYCSDGILPRAYGLPKIHKPGRTFRLIVSSIDSLFYALASFLQKILTENIPHTFSHVENSFQLIEKLKNLQFDDNYILISLDVISLFTNIPLDLALESVSRRWELVSRNCSIPHNEFITGLKMILESTYFLFDNQMFKQNFGTPMGSPLSPIIADLVMRDLEERSLRTLGFGVPFYARYVDDIVMAVRSEKVDEVSRKFNTFHDRLQFTLEVGGNKLNFLDVTIIKNNNRIMYNWYHKPTFSGRYLNFLSQHPFSQKRGTVMGLVDRVFFLAHPEFHLDNLKFVITLLLENDYPLRFVFDTINTRLKYLIRARQNRTVNNPNESNKKWFAVPFIRSLSEKFKHVIKDLDARIAYYSLNKLGSIIKRHKDSLPDSFKMNVVYKLKCSDCNASYVGQTCRSLKTRIAEHRNHINRNTTTQSVITEHRIGLSHDFDWNNVEILDVERFYTKRLISEMLHIRLQDNSLNLQTDTECLDDGIVAVLNRL